jgi:tRNA dimethylallyltransferase
VNSVKKALDPNTQVIYVGGTGLYVSAIVDGFEFPPEDLALRKELENKYQNKTEKAYKKLIELDSKAAEKIDHNNFRRTIRALEVIEISHKKFSDYRTTYDGVNESADFFGLYQTRLQGRESIAQRVNTMFSEGWIDEVQSLLTEGISVTASKAIGYKQILEAISVNSFTNLEEIITNKTVKFSRRQRMWFKRDSRIRWMFGDYKHNLDRVTEYIKEEVQC